MSLFSIGFDLDLIRFYLEAKVWALEIPFENIESATDNFADENLIAQGSSGKFYRGQLLQSEKMIDIVVRVFKRTENFYTEIMIFCKLEHENISPILYWAMNEADDENTFFIHKKIEANGSLAEHLSGSTLTWTQRLSICIGVGQALKYIHYSDFHKPGYYVIHGNINSSEIFLDDDWQPKLHGFGRSAMVAMVAERNTLFATNKYEGTLQYKDPAYEKTGALTDKSDVFSFGVVLFEVLFGRKAAASTPNEEQADNWNFAEFARLHCKNKTLDKMIDPDMLKNMDPKSIEIFSNVAYFCLTEQREQRPNMDEVVRELEESLELQKNHERSMVTETSSRHLQGKSFEHLLIPQKDILSATEIFHPKYKIGSGGFATVYKAKLEHFESEIYSTIEGGDDGSDMSKVCSTVAIKLISSTANGLGEKGFIAEVQMLSKFKHQNIVSLLGFCNEGHQKILIYEYVPNGSLDNYLERSYRRTNLTWDRRIQICLDIAHGLEYLHTRLPGKEIIIHRDIKSANILLDDNLRAKIADFGLSRLYTIHSKNSTINTVNIAGTELYLDPEYMKTGKLKKASDIYSFGVVLFEILCGTLAYDKIYTTNTEKGLPSIARRLFKEGKSKTIIDPSIMETDGSIFLQNRVADQHSLDTFLNMASQCLAETQDERPTIKEVIKELETALNFQKINQDNLQVLLKDINLATQGFSDCNCIGVGKFWKLYKGEVPEAISNAKGCTAIVAKRWNKSVQGNQQFFGELEFVFKNKNEAVTKLVGYCTEMEEKIIVYEHSSKGTLDKHLKDVSLTWKERLQICVDVVKGLRFFNSREGALMMHAADIKSGNILIDGKRKIQIANLELSTTDTFDQNTHNQDPSIITVSKKSYGYALGVLFVEVLSGRLASEDPSKPFGPLAIDWWTRSEHELDEMVFEGIKDQIDPLSLREFIYVVNKCFANIKQSLDNLFESLHLTLERQEEFEACPQISLEDIKLGTQNFSDDKCVAKGKHWKLYEGEFPDANADGFTTALVKRWDNKSREVAYEFLAERSLLSRHTYLRNIIGIEGYCHEMDESIIVYEHGYSRSLDKHLDDASFGWMKRLEICKYVAQGADSLHTIGIGLGDIKSGSILIDGDWKVKVFILELSLKNLTYHDSQTELLVVLLEMLCGRLDRGEGCESYSESLKSLAQRHYKEKGNLDDLVFEGIKEKIAPESLNLFVDDIVSDCLESPERIRPSDMAYNLVDAWREQVYVEESPQISLKDIKSATHDFSNEKCIGEGRYWKLYEGEFPHANANGYTTALVKRWDSKSSQGRQQFFRELKIHYQFKENVNIVAVEGYCSEKNEKIIVFEHAYYRTLDKHLDDTCLSWTKRLNICINVASVLNFFHNIRWEPYLMHGDIKSGSILIDGDWNAKVSNFENFFACYGEWVTDNELESSLGYVDPQHQGSGMVKDIYSLGVVLLEMMCGRLAWPEGLDDHSRSLGPLAQRHYKEKGNLDELVFTGIKEQIAPESLTAYQEIALKCIADTEYWQPVVPKIVLKKLKNALELQEDYEMGNSKLPKEYKEYIRMSKTPEVYSTKVKNDLYNMLTKGILLQQGKLLFMLGANGGRNEMISAMMFSYKNRSSRIWQSIPESRFQKVAQMLDISNLKIQIRIKTQFLSPGINYGVHLVFKFCQSRKSRTEREYVNLSYKRGKDNLHAYFATWRDDEWMMIELCRFSNDKKDVEFEAFLKSFSRCYCGSRIIYVDGIEFRSIDNVNCKEIEKSKVVQQVLKSYSNIDEVQQSTIECHEISKILGNDEDGEKMFKVNEVSINEVNRKKYLRLSPMEFLYDSCNMKPFDLNPSSVSRSEKVEFLPQQVFGIKCKIESQMLSPDTDYMCYLVFKFSEKCNGLHGPVIIRDLLNWKNKEAGILYFRLPSPWNLHDTDSVPRARKDGWMEVTVWKFNSKSKLRNDSVPMNLKLITYDGTMSGLIVCNLEIRPI